MIRMGLSPKTRKLTDDQVHEIKCRIAAGVGTVKIAREFNVSPATVSHIRTGAMFARIKL